MQRLDEKRELVQLNERFVQYVRRVRELKQESDVSALYDSIQTLEEELRLLRASYENQIAQLQASMEILSKEKFELDRKFHTKRSNEAHLLDRLQVEIQKSEKLTAEVMELRKESDLKEERMKKLQEISSNWKCENEELRGKYDECLESIQFQQQKLRQEEEIQHGLQMKISSLETKIQLSEKYFEETQSELRSQLEDYSQRIVDLDKVLDSAGRREASLPDIIYQLKETAKQEFHQFQEEMESFYHDSMRLLQTKLEEEQQKSRNLQKSVDELKDKLLARQTAISQVNAELAGLKQQRQLIEETLKRERQEANTQIGSLERKLRDLQELMVNKLNEAAAAHHPEVTLNAEIETLKEILTEEERRLDMDETNQEHVKEPIKSKLDVYHSHTVPLIVESNKPSSEELHNQISISPVINENIKDPFYEPKNQLISSPKQALLESQRFASSSSPDSSINGVDKQELSPEPKENMQVNTFHSKEDVKKRKDVNTKSKRSPSLPANLKDPNLLRSQPNNTENLTGGPSVDLKFVEVNKDGQFIRIINSTENEDIELGGYFVQVNFGNQPMAIFRFPPGTKIRPGQTVTVWSLVGMKSHTSEHHQGMTMEEKSRLLNRPPGDFAWPELDKWPTGSVYTTLLCRPDGQVIYWFTKNSRRSQTFFQSLSSSRPGLSDSREKTEGVKLPDVRRPTSAVVYGSSSPSQSKFSDDIKSTTKLLMNEDNSVSGMKSLQIVTTESQDVQKQQHSTRLSRSALSNKSKYGSSQEDTNTQYTYVKSQLISQESENRIVSAKRAAFQSRKGVFNSRDNIVSVSHVTGAIFNRGPEIFLRSAIEPPNPFSKPSLRVKQGVNQVISIQNTKHQPALPKPPLFSEW